MKVTYINEMTGEEIVEYVEFEAEQELAQETSGVARVWSNDKWKIVKMNGLLMAVTHDEKRSTGLVASVYQASQVANIPAYVLREMKKQFDIMFTSQIVKQIKAETKPVPVEKIAKVKQFERYNDLLVKSLQQRLSEDEQNEYNTLYRKLELHKGNEVYKLAKQAFQITDKYLK